MCVGGWGYWNFCLYSVFSLNDIVHEQNYWLSYWHRLARWCSLRALPSPHQNIRGSVSSSIWHALLNSDSTTQ